jgi:hypothetical protein
MGDVLEDAPVSEEDAPVSEEDGKLERQGAAAREAVQ